MCSKALKAALFRYKIKDNSMHHSDRGSQNASYEYQDLLKQYGIICSTSRKGNCYDKAISESVFATFEKERFDGRLFDDLHDARARIFEYIEVFYNRQRIHSSINYLSPVRYEIYMNLT